jgi:hypothetical protein
MVNQSCLNSIRGSPAYKYAFEIPRSVKHAMDLDAKNGNTRWGDAIHTEISQTLEYMEHLKIVVKVLKSPTDIS